MERAPNRCPSTHATEAAARRGDGAPVARILRGIARTSTSSSNSSLSSRPTLSGIDGVTPTRCSGMTEATARPKGVSISVSPRSPIAASSWRLLLLSSLLLVLLLLCWYCCYRHCCCYHCCHCCWYGFVFHNSSRSASAEADGLSDSYAEELSRSRSSKPASC